jgi:hypothetical protein
MQMILFYHHMMDAPRNNNHEGSYYSTRKKAPLNPFAPTTCTLDKEVVVGTFTFTLSVNWFVHVPVSGGEHDSILMYCM